MSYKPFPTRELTYQLSSRLSCLIDEPACKEKRCSRNTACQPPPRLKQSLAYYLHLQLTLKRGVSWGRKVKKKKASEGGKNSTCPSLITTNELPLSKLLSHQCCGCWADSRCERAQLCQCDQGFPDIERLSKTSLNKIKV